MYVSCNVELQNATVFPLDVDQAPGLARMAYAGK